MSSLDRFNLLLERVTTLDEMAQDFKQLQKGAATGEDGLNLMLKAYRNEKTGKPVGAVSRVKNLIVLRALYDKDYINDEQFQALSKKATSSNYISNTLKELNPTAHEKLFGDAQESEGIIKHIKLNAKDMLNFGLTNLRGKSFVEVQEDEPVDPDAKELEDEVTDEVISLAKGLTSDDLEGTILDFDDVDVSLEGLENKEEITRKLVSILNGAGYTAEPTPAGFNVEAPIGSFGTEEKVQDLMAGLILKHFPGVDESLLDIKLNTTIEDAETMNEPVGDFAEVGVEEVYPDDQAGLPDDYHDEDVEEDAEIDDAYKAITSEVAKLYNRYVVNNEKLTADDINAVILKPELKRHPAMQKATAKQYPSFEHPQTKAVLNLRSMVNSIKNKWSQNLAQQDEEETVTESYTSQYLTEQASSDSRNKKTIVESQSFREHYKPKTHWQLEELRRYGL